MKYRNILIAILVLCVTFFYSKKAIIIQVENEVNNLIAKSDIVKANDLLLLLAYIYNDPKANFELGVNYESGFGVNRNIDKAKMFYEKALKLKHKDASYNLAMLSLKDNDYNYTIKYLSIYIDEINEYRENLVNAYLIRGYMYYYNINPKLIDKTKSFNDYNKVLDIDLNNTTALLNIGIMYLNGDGVIKNNKQAFKYLKIAAAANNAEAQYNLGEMFLNGVGVNKNLIESEKWLKMASDNSFNNASCNLAILYKDNKFSNNKDDNIKNVNKYTKRCIELN